MASVLPTSGAALAASQPLSARWKTRLDEQRRVLETRYLENRSAPELLLRLRVLADGQLKAVWEHLGMPPALTLVAVGGYGRGQLFPYSDIDLLILLPAASDPGQTPKLEQFVGMLWDIGLEVGHSVRTIAECVALAAQDITVQTSLLEARLLAGDRKQFRHFEKEFAHALDARQFCKAKQLEQEQRHERYRDTNLEPNIKETAGGLRDLHNILWIAKAAGIGAAWSDLASRDIITRREAVQLRQHESFLQNLRIRLHYLARRREERLVFDVQTALALQMGLHDTATAGPVSI